MKVFSPGARILELGGGSTPRYHPNADVRWLPQVDIPGVDFNWPLPIPSGQYDGVYCFPGDTLVGGSTLFIKELVPERSNVSGSDGKEQAVAARSERFFSGDIVRIKAAGLYPVHVTPEHLILVSSLRKVHRAMAREGRKGRYDYSVAPPTWKEARDVVSGDWLIVPRLSESCDSVLGMRFGRSHKLREIALDANLSWLLGLYVAEGHTSKHEARRHRLICFSLGSHEESLAERAVEVFETTGYHAWKSQPPTILRQHSLHVLCASKFLADWLDGECGMGASEKRVPSCVKIAPPHIVRAFLQGLIDGDGCRSGTSYLIGTVSKRLALGVWELLLKLGIGARIETFPARTRKFAGHSYRCKEIYNVLWSTRAWEGLLDRAGRQPYAHMKILNDYAYVPVRQVARTPVERLPVYNIRTTDETYGVPFVVHNCQYILEHISWRKVRGFIGEVHRILRPGGVAVFITANLLEQCRALVATPEWNDALICMVFGDNDYPENTHRAGFSPEYATRLFKEAGFHKVTVYPHPNCVTDMILECRKSQALIEVKS